MKTRYGFVSNSSSSSFIVEMEGTVTDRDHCIPKLKEYFKRHPMGFHYEADTPDGKLNFNRKDFEDFIFKLFQSGNMKPLGKWLLEVFWDDLLNQGKHPWSMESLSVEEALEVLDRSTYHDATVEEALECVMERLEKGADYDDFYVFDVGSDVDYNDMTIMIKFNHGEYALSRAIRDNASELGEYEIFRLSW